MANSIEKAPPQIILLSDYTPSAFNIKAIELSFEFCEHFCDISSSMKIVRNQQAELENLVLNGEELELTGLALDGQPLSEPDYILAEETLTILNPPDSFELSVNTRVYPEKNTSLSGLYKSSGNYCTQCEAEGVPANHLLS